ncbi:hypothetical protein GWK47_004831 [Chionoecetes opilio]|uniref:Uncharacterized protein n=1 Tax=Chionoecetes opilio TaxID=41210 RepID=A0A8J4YKH6_CHIOP|nr:hypothetical protein GWK47_004831 [Chionoecetes opilio]
MKAFALAELVTYIKENSDSVMHPVFRLADLMKIYTFRLTQMGIDVEKHPNSTRLKEILLNMVPGLIAHSEGIYVLMMFEEGVGEGIRAACNQRIEADAMILAKAAAIVRRDMFQTHYNFSGSFEETFQDDVVPEKLKALVNMILQGPNIKDQTKNDNKSTGLTIAQLMMFNSVKHQRRHQDTSLAILSQDHFTMAVSKEAPRTQVTSHNLHLPVPETQRHADLPEICYRTFLIILPIIQHQWLPVTHQRQGLPVLPHLQLPHARTAADVSTWADPTDSEGNAEDMDYPTTSSLDVHITKTLQSTWQHLARTPPQVCCSPLDGKDAERLSWRLSWDHVRDSGCGLSQDHCISLRQSYWEYQ